MGKNVHSKVYQAHFMNCDVTYAVKIFIKSSLGEKENFIYRQLNAHPNIPKVHSFVKESAKL